MMVIPDGKVAVAGAAVGGAGVGEGATVLVGCAVSVGCGVTVAGGGTSGLQAAKVIAKSAHTAVARRFVFIDMSFREHGR